MKSKYSVLDDVKELFDDANVMIGELQRAQKRLSEKYNLLSQAIKRVFDSETFEESQVQQRILYDLVGLPNTKPNKNE